MVFLKVSEQGLEHCLVGKVLVEGSSLSLSVHFKSQVWWLMLKILAPGRQRQETLRAYWPGSLP